MDLLLSSGASATHADKRGRTALHWAAFRRHADVVQRLVDVDGVNVDGRDKDGFSAIHVAAAAGANDVLDTLSEVTSENLTFTSTVEGNTALHLASLNGHEDALRLLLRFARSEDVKAKNGRDETCLHLASMGPVSDLCLDLLLEEAKNVTFLNAVSSTGRSALHFAAVNGHAQRCQKLLASGVRATTKDAQGNTALHLAAKKGHEDVVKVLASRCPELCDVKNVNGRSALLLACLDNHPRCVEYLLQAVDDPVSALNVTDLDQRNAIHLAAIKG